MTKLDPDRIRRRLASLDKAGMLVWADAAVSGMMRHLDDFRRTADEQHLGEISLAAAILGLMVDELAERERQARKLLDSGSHPE